MLSKDFRTDLNLQSANKAEGSKVLCALVGTGRRLLKQGQADTYSLSLSGGVSAGLWPSDGYM